MLAKEMLNIDDHVSWSIENDNTADWAIERIKEVQEEYNRIENLINMKIQQLQMKLQSEKEKLDKERGFFEGHLQDYFSKQENLKETKTQLQLKLPSGKLKLVKATKTFDYDKSKLLKVAEENQDMQEYIKIKKDFDWAGFKKQLDIRGDKIIARETGEVIELEGLSIIEKPAVFKVEVE